MGRIIIRLISIVLEIFVIIFLIASCSCKKKSLGLNLVATIFSTIVIVIGLFDMTIPQPIISPLNNLTTKYYEPIVVTIESDGLEIYYSLNGDDPKNGNKYNNPITVSETTTVCARSRFFIWWSDIAKSAYGFEKIDPVFSSDENAPNIPNNIPYSQQETKENEYTTDVITENESNTADEYSESNETDLNQEDTNINTEESKPGSLDESKQSELQLSSEPSEIMNINEGINSSEGYNLMIYINQYRKESGVPELTWNTNLEFEAQNLATSFATGSSNDSFIVGYSIGRQCNGAKNASRAVSDWINGNAYVPSESDILLSTEFTQIGGALYYLPDGNRYGYHFFWIVCLL